MGGGKRKERKTKKKKKKKKNIAPEILENIHYETHCNISTQKILSFGSTAITEFDSTPVECLN